ncbi:hypothetical protein PsorP6_005344 [Peronosclerospora sorghi]|uniref:Uncharacterized protein n=1 Tax=Peronosclerospora sorghi TaxID=230839 RepID=A0ACC0W4P6_9STRA|nr:hypothetical protein PsorP6_005344 [Peronosclerospora sorghi]
MKRLTRRVRTWSLSRDELSLHKCGQCCTGNRGHVRVNERECQELAQATNLSLIELRRRYTREIEEEDADGQKTTHFVLKQTSDDRQCIFLQGSKCSVYNARPTQCRTFPWWPQHLVSDYDWQVAAAKCEGINANYEQQEGDSNPTYSFNDVILDAILYDIHRSGENFTYKELQQMLHDLRQVEPEFIAQYKAEFFEKFSRRVVYSDDTVTVLDNWINGITRSFVFNDRLHLIQSEVALYQLPDAHVDDEPKFDRTTLSLDVHRAMCLPIAWLQSRNKISRPFRITVLGAGACTLPLFLLKHFSPQQMERIDAVEPNSKVNAIARRFFGVEAVLLRDQRLVIHEKMGENYLADRKKDATLDLVVLDVDAGSNRVGIRAPALTMLESSFLFTVKRQLVPHGILALNVITESTAGLRIVEAKLGHVFAHGLRISLAANTIFFLFNEKCDDDIVIDLDRYVRLIRDCRFQTHHALTPDLLNKYQLTPWLSQSLNRGS